LGVSARFAVKAGIDARLIRDHQVRASRLRAAFLFFGRTAVKI
jgi:hypothetical protein